MSASFIPGPWKVEATDRPQGDWKWREIVAADPEEGKPVVLAEVYADDSGYPFDDHAEANARLIAAAPCMAAYVRKRADAGDVEAIELWERINAHS